MIWSPSGPRNRPGDRTKGVCHYRAGPRGAGRGAAGHAGPRQVQVGVPVPDAAGRPHRQPPHRPGLRCPASPSRRRTAAGRSVFARCSGPSRHALRQRLWPRRAGSGGQVHAGRAEQDSNRRDRPSGGRVGAGQASKGKFSHAALVYLGRTVRHRGGGWLGSGYVIPSPATSSMAESTTAADQPFAVQVKTFKARDREARVTVRGYTEASRQVAVRARTKGLIVASPFAQGDSVKQGDVLCRLDMGARKTQLAQTEAALASASRDYEATRKLAVKDFVSASKLASDRARLDLAATEREQMLHDIGYTRITAPVDGVLSIQAGRGGRISAGRRCVRHRVGTRSDQRRGAGRRARHLRHPHRHAGQRSPRHRRDGERHHELHLGTGGRSRHPHVSSGDAGRQSRPQAARGGDRRTERCAAAGEGPLLPPSALTLDDAGNSGYASSPQATRRSSCR